MSIDALRWAFRLTTLPSSGSNDVSNRVLACKRCNARKGSKTLEELGWSNPLTRDRSPA